jgi:hypothetical protein
MERWGGPLGPGAQLLAILRVSVHGWCSCFPSLFFLFLSFFSCPIPAGIPRLRAAIRQGG